MRLRLSGYVPAVFCQALSPKLMLLHSHLRPGATAFLAAGQPPAARPFLLGSGSFSRDWGRLLPWPFLVGVAAPFFWHDFCGNVLQVAALRLGAGWWLVGFGAWVCRVGWVVSGRVPVGLCFFGGWVASSGFILFSWCVSVFCVSVSLSLSLSLSLC